MPGMARLPLVILAGGLARRLGGDKALRPLAGRPLLAHVLDRMAGQAGPILINANGDPGRFAGFGLPVAGDSVPGHPGPLAGILAGLEWARGLGAEAVISVPADCPFLPRDLVARLTAARAAAGAKAAVAASGGRRHPVVGLWPVSSADALRQALAAGMRAVEAWTDRLGTAVAEVPAGPVDPFFNVNTAQDLARAERLWDAGACAP